MCSSDLRFIVTHHFVRHTHKSRSVRLIHDFPSQDLRDESIRENEEKQHRACIFQYILLIPIAEKESRFNTKRRRGEPLDGDSPRP